MHSAARLPFGAVAPLLHAISPEPEAAAVDDRVDLLRRSVAALAEQPDGRRLLLFVDDAHLLDDASATLVHQVAATVTAVVLATVRTGEPAPDPVVALWKDGLAERVEISGLQPESIDELLGRRARRTGGPGDGRAVRRAVPGQRTVPARAGDRRARGRQPAGRRGHLASRPGAVALLAPGRDRRGPARPAPRRRAGPDGARGLRRAARAGRVGGPVRPGARRGARAPRPARQPPGRRSSPRPPGPSHLRRRRARPDTGGARPGDRRVAGRGRRSGPAPSRDEDILRVATWRLRAGGGRADVLLEGAAIARWRYDFPLAERLARAAARRRRGVRRRPARSACRQPPGTEGRGGGRVRGPRRGGRRRLPAPRCRGRPLPERRRLAGPRDELRMLDEAGGAVVVGDGATPSRPGGSVVCSTRRAHGRPSRPRWPCWRRARGEALAFACLVGGVRPGPAGRLDGGHRADRTGRGRAASTSTRHWRWYPWWHTVARASALATPGGSPRPRS